MKQNIVVAALFGILTMLQFSATAQTAGKDCRKGRNLFPRFFKADNARSDTLDVLHIHLDLDMTMMDDDQISAVASILVEAKIDGVAEVNFDLLNLTVDSVLAGPNQLSFNYVGELLKIDVPEVLNIGDQLTVDIHYQGSPQTDDSGWGGFYFQGDYAYNLGVGFEADPHTYGRAWFPCFDNFVERSTYTFDVLTSQGRSAYCNGLLNEVEELPGDSAIYHWSLSQSIPSYLASVAVSHFSPAISNFASISGADIPVYLTAQAEDTANAKASFIELDLCLETFEERFGPYLWDRVGYAFVPFSSGAMEHATNISYPLYAADGSTAFNTLMAHELAHHWWGDLITCRTQEDMWLNEGWASFCEFLFIEALEGEEAYLEMVKDNHKDVVLHAHEDDGERLPVSGIGHEHTYGTHVYNKGADMAYNLRAYMGDDDFFEGTTDFLEDHAFTDVSSHDLMTYLSDFGDADLEAFFDNWIYEPGWCAMSLDSFWVQDQGDEFLISVFTHQQVHYAPELYESVPVTYTAFDALGNSEQQTKEITGEDSFTTFTTSFEPEYIIVNLENELSMAMFTEQARIGDTGFEQLNYAEFMVGVDDIAPGDSISLIVQNYWVSADQDHVEYHVADDRFWRLHVDMPESAEASGRIRYYGNDQSGTFYDPIFFEDLAAQGMTEDSLILVFRDSPAQPWQEHEAYELNIQGSATNWQGLIDFDNLRSGDYAWAYRTGKVGVNEMSVEASIYPNPFSDELIVQGLPIDSDYRVHNSQGQLITSGITNNHTLRLDGRQWATGSYQLIIGGKNYSIIKK